MLGDKLVHPLRRVIATFVRRFMPKKTKRLVFISTLFAGIKDIQETSPEHLQCLNELMGLCEIKEAISLPMFFGAMLWKKKLPEGIFLHYRKNPPLQLCEINNKELSEVEMRVIANTIINHTPCWLLYTSRRKMRDDLVLLLEMMPKMGFDESGGH